ncbi:DNA-directed RNA polymerase sigma-70 factor [Acrocarpospora phusangensis]|uniref:DNA-directed RNA polymerase sigma-70 factor n=1 Tax=Acrocarpospora phusangensis TaxID=1070424 RepID=A0A919QFP7_9ACTN|nr:sigma-70 family RNA polymerase sigma factor [Acrocarpospora phusangensis]GIH26683.1 DNA-directed RNA polymerase sigma-70 factor [Acrocarpospora phusangensis]
MTSQPEPGPSVGTADRGHERRDRLAGLLARAQEGERAAWDALVTELTPMLWHTVRAQGLGYESAQDVVQTTWLVLVRRQHSVSTPGALIEWLVTTARREAWRARARERSADLLGEDALEDVADPVALPEELLLADERRLALWRAVGSLSRRCQVLLRVVAFAPRPHYDAVAKALEMPMGSIGPTRGRCLAKLRVTLAADPSWNPDWRTP